MLARPQHPCHPTCSHEAEVGTAGRQLLPAARHRAKRSAPLAAFIRSGQILVKPRPALEGTSGGATSNWRLIYYIKQRCGRAGEDAMLGLTPDNIADQHKRSQSREEHSYRMPFSFDESRQAPPHGLARGYGERLSSLIRMPSIQRKKRRKSGTPP